MTKQEAIKKAMELQERRAALLGYSSGMTEKMFGIFDLEELVELNKEDEKEVRRMERAAAKAKREGREIRWVPAVAHEGFGDD